ncbi:MAG: hypothetical protein IJY21_00260 [Clostridia bacterium]|nr:hypothetical protein [Clostridia bacterium]
MKNKSKKITAEEYEKTTKEFLVIFFEKVLLLPIKFDTMISDNKRKGAGL